VNGMAAFSHGRDSGARAAPCRDRAVERRCSTLSVRLSNARNERARPSRPALTQLSAKKTSRVKVILPSVISRRPSADSLRPCANLLAFVFTRLVVRRTRLARVDRYAQGGIASQPLVGDTAAPPRRVRVLVRVGSVVAHWSVRTMLVLRPMGRLARGRSGAASLVLAMPCVRPFAPAPLLVEVPPLRAQARLTRRSAVTDQKRSSVGFATGIREAMTSGFEEPRPRAEYTYRQVPRSRCTTRC